MIVFGVAGVSGRDGVRKILSHYYRMGLGLAAADQPQSRYTQVADMAGIREDDTGALE
jgi:hypothetical protein